MADAPARVPVPRRGAQVSSTQGHCALARVGGARTFRLDLGLLVTDLYGRIIERQALSAW